MQDILYS